MPKHQVQIRETVAAPPERVFAFFADHERFATLFGGTCRRVVDGPAEANGLGSVRRIGAGAWSFDEAIVAFDRPRRIEYRITRGSPLKNHRGTIEFRAVGDSTVVDYAIRFDSRLPGCGGLFAWLLGRAWNRHAPTQLARLT